MYLLSQKNRIASLLLFLSCLIFTNISFAESAESSSDFPTTLELLLSKSYKDKEQAIGKLVATKDERVQKILEAMLNARLFYMKSDKNIVIGVKQDDDYLITDQLSQKEIGTVSKSYLKKIKVNNKLRRILRSAIQTSVCLVLMLMYA